MTRVPQLLELYVPVEMDHIRSMKRGNGLLVANTNHVFIEVRDSKTEYNLITTDRKDLASIIAESDEDA